ncbi:hypothetical protein [Bradyrhizobium neotropicale]|uniref:Autotransporter domain-containing protein n=1 Tax=Bradyrhizobium neotropicale TaxID=1497615 RepID=A0A176YUB7_9BRAD|nr:hypothetical protein [Bradyrhizobium neotropicale]OAF10379.1 hypothetical protein AXW67_00890 [Bradyrhizobium neotropicale]
MKRRLLSTVNRGLLRIPASAFLLAPWIMVEPAGAACTPPSPVNDAVVTCTGTTTNANGTIGYGSATDTGNTFNLVSGATVFGTTSGITLNQGRSPTAALSWRAPGPRTARPELPPWGT